VACLCSPLLISYRYLAHHGETLNARQVVDRLEREPGTIYRSIMHDNLRETALEIVRRRQPEIVALGSSLTLDFRQEFFTRPFACAGGVMDTLADGELFVTQMLKEARPQMVLFVLNFWWFTDAQVPLRGRIGGPEEAPRLSFSQLRVPYKQVRAQLITPSQLLLLQPLPSFEAVRNPPLGLMAHLDHVGRRADGSQLNGLVFSDEAWDFYAPVRERFANIDRYILQPGRFGPDLTIRADRVELLQNILRRLGETGCHVILLNPPMAPPLVEAMRRSGRHQHYFDLAPVVRELGAEFYDFADPVPLGIPMSEFADTHHAGNTAYMRLLLEIVRRNPGSPLAGGINAERLAEWVDRFAGGTVAVLGSDMIQTRETDFLGLGVQKPSPAPR
jgi:hypothetical protein